MNIYKVIAYLIKCSDYCVSIGYCSTNGCSVIESCSCNVSSLGFVRPRKENDKKYMFCSKLLIKLNRELVSMKLSKISSANVVTIVVAHSKSLFHSRGHSCMK